jgi:2-oxoglutarate ferredoxin oxidoreductase subunit delta
MVKRKTKNSPPSDPGNQPESYWETKKKLDRKGKKLFVQKIFADWCKACGLCIAFCPENVFTNDENGMPLIQDPDACTGCRFCEFHCPDFALSIHERYPDRRRKDNGT